MQTHLAPEFKGTRDGEAAEAILRKCVHCGFCTATCPTYQLLGDELDGPRGRIYLMKQVLEGAPVTRATQQHLDRCLTCRNCETTCPSGVQYGHLVDIGRKLVEQRVERPAKERAVRWLLKEGLTSPLFGPAMKLGQLARPLLPAALKLKVPAAAGSRAKFWPTRTHKRKVLLLLGCVQPAMMPNINSATARVLDAAGIQTLVADDAGCCGAIRTHLNDAEGGLADMRRNIDAWWPLVDGLTSEGTVEAIVMNASGCGVTVKDYGHALAHDPDYADKARRVSALTRDLSELLPDLVGALKPKLRKSRATTQAGLPPALHAAAWPAAARRRRAPPGRAGLRRAAGWRRKPPVLRQRRHLQRAAARTGHPAARPQAGEPAAAAGAGHRVGQHRLHPAPADRHHHAGAHWVEVLDEALA
jgi:glycolate oxidase iron-sulfur subunit